MRLWFLGKALAMLAVVSFLAAPVLAGSDAASSARRPYLGIAAAAKESDQSGVIVAQLQPGSPAEKAGLKKGDRIVIAGDKEVKTFEDLTKALADCKPGDKLALKVLRASNEQTITVTLGDAPSHRKGEKASDPKGHAYLGAFVQSLTPDLKDQLDLNVKKGALVIQVLPDSPAAQAGLREEDVVTHVGNKAVATAKELSDAIVQLGTGKEVELTVARGKESIKLKAQLQEVPDIGKVIFAERGDWPEHLEAFSDSLWPFFPGLERKPSLEKKVEELEKRLHELEQKTIK
jgi:S1-C subfamily serine protease